MIFFLHLQTVYFSTTVPDALPLSDIFRFTIHPLSILFHSSTKRSYLPSYLYRRKYASVRCIAFSPPGCVLNGAALTLSEQFICSVVLGDDLVPRMSYQSMLRLKRAIIEAVHNCDKPKYEILLKGCFKILCAPPTTADSMQDQGGLTK